MVLLFAACSPLWGTKGCLVHPGFVPVDVGEFLGCCAPQGGAGAVSLEGDLTCSAQSFASIMVSHLCARTELVLEGQSAALRAGFWGAGHTGRGTDGSLWGHGCEAWPRCGGQCWGRDGDGCSPSALCQGMETCGGTGLGPSMSPWCPVGSEVHCSLCTISTPPTLSHDVRGDTWGAAHPTRGSSQEEI